MSVKICTPIYGYGMWKAVPGYEGFYEAHPDGRVRSVERTITQRNGRVRTFPGVELTPVLNKITGYFQVTLQREGTATIWRLNRVVLVTFVPEPEGGALALHRNDVKSENNLSNLYWGTHLQNAADAFANGKRVLSDRCGKGHPFTPENTYYPPGRPRQCRQCTRDRNRELTGVVNPRGPYKGRAEVGVG